MPDNCHETLADAVAYWVRLPGEEGEGDEEEVDEEDDDDKEEEEAESVTGIRLEIDRGLAPLSLCEMFHELVNRTSLNGLVQAVAVRGFSSQPQSTSDGASDDLDCLLENVRELSFEGNQSLGNGLLELENIVSVADLQSLRANDLGFLATPIDFKVLAERFLSLETLVLRDVRIKGGLENLAALGGTLKRLELSITVADQREGGFEVRPELGNLTKLEHLVLDAEALTGSLPSELGELNLLQTLQITSPRLEPGPIPSWLGHLSLLTSLNLRDSKRTGKVPFALNSLSRLQSLNLRNNQLRGGFPELLSLRPFLDLDVSNNELDGDFAYPDWSEQLPRATDLRGNRFTSVSWMNPTEVGAALRVPGAASVDPAAEPIPADGLQLRSTNLRCSCDFLSQMWSLSARLAPGPGLHAEEATCLYGAASTSAQMRLQLTSYAGGPCRAGGPFTSVATAFYGENNLTVSWSVPVSRMAELRASKYGPGPSLGEPPAGAADVVAHLDPARRRALQSGDSPLASDRCDVCAEYLAMLRKSGVEVRQPFLAYLVRFMPRDGVEACCTIVLHEDGVEDYALSFLQGTDVDLNHGQVSVTAAAVAPSALPGAVVEGGAALLLDFQTTAMEVFRPSGYALITNAAGDLILTYPVRSSLLSQQQQQQQQQQQTAGDLLIISDTDGVEVLSATLDSSSGSFEVGAALEAIGAKTKEGATYRVQVFSESNGSDPVYTTLVNTFAKEVLKSCPPGKGANSFSSNTSAPVEGGPGPGQGRDTCDTCPTGTYSTGNMVVCHECPLGTTTRNPGAPAADNCSMAFTGYFDCDTSDRSCEEGFKACLPQMVCDDVGTTKENVILRDGFWRPDVTSLEIYQCPNKQFCRPSAGSQLCTEHHTGVVCSECEDGFAIVDTVCQQCTDSRIGVSWLFVTFLVFIILVVVGAPLARVGYISYYHLDRRDKERIQHEMSQAGEGPAEEAPTAGSPGERSSTGGGSQPDRLVGRDTASTTGSSSAVDADDDLEGGTQASLGGHEPGHSPLGPLNKNRRGWKYYVAKSGLTKLRIATSFFQIYLVYARFLVADNMPMRSLLKYGIVDLACLFNLNHYGTLMLWTFVPLLLIASMGGALALARSGLKRDAELLAHAKVELSNLLLISVWSVFPPTASIVLSSFICQDIGDEVRLRADLSIECGEQHAGWVVYASVMLIVFVLGIPALFIGLLLRFRKILALPSWDTPNEHCIANSIHFLHHPYTHRSYWFEAYEMIRKLLQVGSAVLLTPALLPVVQDGAVGQQTSYASLSLVSSFPQVVVSMFLALSALFMLQIIQPYRNRFDSALASISMANLVAVCIAVMVQSSRDSDATADAAGATSPANDYGWVIGAVLIFEVIVAFGLFVYDVCHLSQFPDREDEMRVKMKRNFYHSVLDPEPADAFARRARSIAGSLFPGSPRSSSVAHAASTGMSLQMGDGEAAPDGHAALARGPVPLSANSATSAATTSLFGSTHSPAASTSGPSLYGAAPSDMDAVEAAGVGPGGPAAAFMAQISSTETTESFLKRHTSSRSINAPVGTGTPGSTSVGYETGGERGESADDGVTDTQSTTVELNGVEFTRYGFAGAHSSPCKDDLVRFGTLGYGASGVVHVALDCSTFDLVALKEVSAHDQSSASQAVREVRTLQQLGKFGPDGLEVAPRVIQLKNAYFDPEIQAVCIATPFMAGGSLQDAIDASQIQAEVDNTGSNAAAAAGNHLSVKLSCERMVKPRRTVLQAEAARLNPRCKDVPPADADVSRRAAVCNEDMLACVARDVLEALAYLHEHECVHLDVKPANVLLDTHGRAVLADFGLAQKLADYYDGSKFIGTLKYMCPERLRGNPATFASDIWSFGMTLLAFTLGAYPLQSASGSSGETQQRSQRELYWSLLECTEGNRDALAVPEFASLSPTGSVVAEPAVVGFSSAFRDFVAQCLCADQAQRPSAAALLEHEWIQAAPSSVDVEPPKAPLAFDESCRTLDRIVSKVLGRREEADDAHSDAGDDASHAANSGELRVSASQIERLAEQLDLSSEIVKYSFLVSGEAKRVVFTG